MLPVEGQTLRQTESAFLDDRAVLTVLERLDFPIVHDPATGRFLPTGDAGGERVAPITAEEARGDSRPVSVDEFRRLAADGKAMLAEFATDGSPPTGLDDHWDAVVTASYTEAQKSWGGITVDAHTGQAVQSSADEYALTVRAPGQEAVTIPENASPELLRAAMDEARTRFAPQLERAQHHLGVFHDDATGLIDIDPVLVVRTPTEVDAIGAYTHAVGGAYHFASGNGHFPPHVATRRAMAQPRRTFAEHLARKPTIAEFLARSRDPNRPLFQPTGQHATLGRLDFPVRHDPATGRFLGKDEEGGQPGEGKKENAPGEGKSPTGAVKVTRELDPKPLPVDEARTYYAPWKTTMTPDEAAAVTGYTEGWRAREVNWGLRNGDATPEALATAAAIDAALDDAPPLPHDVVAYRGVWGDFADHLGGLRPGSMFTERGFTSTDIEGVPPFAAQGDQRLTLEVHVPKEARAAYLGNISRYGPDGDLAESRGEPPQHELLLGSGSSFRVRERKGDTLVVDLVHQQAPIVLDAGPVRKPRAVVSAAGQTGDVTDERERFGWGDPSEVVTNPSAELALVVDGEEVSWLLVSWLADEDGAALLTSHFHHAKRFDSQVADLVRQGLEGDLADSGVFFGPAAVLPDGLVTEMRLKTEPETVIPLRDPKVRPKD